MSIPKIPLRIVVALALVLTLSGFLLTKERKVHVTAYFAQFKGIYVGDDVTVLGVPIGTITSVKAEPHRVKVEFEIDSSQAVPADVRAAVVSPSLVSVRAITLGPVGSDGPRLQDGAVIPESRTAIPVEWDDIKDQLVDLAGALGPNGANSEGSTSDLISAGSRFLEGQGETLNATLTDVSEAMTTLGDNSGDLFATVRNLQVFVTAIKGSDAQVRLFNQRLAEVASILDQDRGALRAAFKGMNSAFGEVGSFLEQNKKLTVQTLRELRSTTSLLSERRQDVADLLQNVPTSVSNFYNMLDPRAHGSLTGVPVVNNLNSPAQIICGALLAVGGDRNDCQQALAPLLKYFAINAPPIGIGTPTKSDPGSGGVKPPGNGQAPQANGDSPSGSGLSDLVDQLLGGL